MGNVGFSTLTMVPGRANIKSVSTFKKLGGLSLGFFTLGFRNDGFVMSSANLVMDLQMGVLEPSCMLTQSLWFKGKDWKNFFCILIIV